MKSNLKSVFILTFCILITSVTAVWAADVEERSDNKTKEEGIANIYDLSVTVTATRTEKDLMDVPVSMSVVTEKQIERAPQSSTAELLKNVPGVYLTDDAIKSGSRKEISIRGFNQNHIIILIDGVRQYYPTSFDGSGALAIDPDEIESIEVIKGASSVLYGSDGLGGVVKITTKKGRGKSLGGRIETRYASIDNSFTPYISIYDDVNGFNYRISASGANKGDRKIHGGETLHNSKSDFEDYSAHLGYMWDKGELNFSAERFNEWNELPSRIVDKNGFAKPMPKEQLEYADRLVYKRNTYTMGFVQRNITDNLDKLTINGSSQKLQNRWISVYKPTGAEEYNSHDTNRSYNGNIQTDWTFFNEHAVSVGFDYNHDYTDIDVVDLYDYVAKQSTMALFFQDEWTLFKGFSITAGLRQTWTVMHFDKSNEGPETTGSRNYSKLVGSLGAVYRGIDNLALRANYSQGFKTPAITNLYANTDTVLANPNLKPEKSNNYEVGLRYDDGTFVTDVAVFYNDYKDAITSIEIGNWVWQMLNANKRETYGTEFYASYRIHSLGLTPYINGTAMRSEMTYADGYKTTDVGNPKLWGKAGVKWEHYFSDTLNVFTNLGLRYTDIYHQRFGAGGRVYTTQATRMLDLAFGVEGGSPVGKFNFVANLENITNEKFLSSTKLPTGFLATVTAGLEF